MRNAYEDDREDSAVGPDRFDDEPDDIQEQIDRLSELLRKNHEKLTAMQQEPSLDPKRGLVIKLCEVMAAVGYMQKRGHNQSQSYRYATEADVAEMMRTEFAKRNVFIFPSIVKNERVRLVRSKSYKDVIEEKVTYATDLEIDWTFVDGDTGQEKTCRIPGCSESPGDKGVYVAMTGSEKYLLMKSFLIPTGDDPEDDKNETDGKGSREAAQDVAKKQLEKGAKSPDPKIRKMAEEGLAKLEAKASQIGSKGASLFFIWFDESQTAEIKGDAGLMKANEDVLKPLKLGGKLVANVEQLEALKYTFEQRNVNFRPLKAN